MKAHNLMICCLTWICVFAIACAASNPKDELTMEANPQTRHCFLGEGFGISVTVRNSSNSPMKLLRPCQASIGIGMTLSTRDAFTNAVTAVQADMNISPNDIVVLAPGQCMSNTVDITDLIDPPDTEGIYMVKVTYRSYGPETLQTHCETSPFQVKYETPSGDAMAAWLLFRDRRDKASGLSKKQVLSDIISKYPHTTYAGQAKKLLKESQLKE